MKKTFFTIFVSLAIISVLFCSACGKKNYAQNVSSLRCDLFYGEQNGIAVTVYPEYKEFPFINDGKVGSRKNFVTVKVVGDIPEDSTVTFLIDDLSYTGQLKYMAVPNALMYTTEVNKLPDDNLTVNINNGKNTLAVQTVSKKQKDLQPYNDAIRKIADDKNDFIKSIEKDGELQAEIYVRLLSEGDKNFWYIGFATGKDCLYSFLVDGKTLSILAEKQYRK